MVRVVRAGRRSEVRGGRLPAEVGTRWRERGPRGPRDLRGPLRSRQEPRHPARTGRVRLMGLRAEGIFGEAVDRIGGQPISARMAKKAPIRHLDPTLLLVTLILTAYGAIVILSVTVHRELAPGTNPNLYLIRQIVFAAAGMAILFVMSFVDYRHFRALAPFVYVATVVGLIVVLTPLGDV